MPSAGGALHILLQIKVMIALSPGASCINAGAGGVCSGETSTVFKTRGLLDDALRRLACGGVGKGEGVF